MLASCRSGVGAAHTITVTVAGQVSSGVAFAYLPPTFTSLTPAAATTNGD